MVFFPDGEKLKLIGKELGEFVAEKNEAYGNSFGTSVEALKLLYPNGITPDQYSDVLTIVRIWNKMMRIATDKDKFGEDPYRDLAGYSILAAERNDRRKQNKGGNNDCES